MKSDDGPTHAFIVRIWIEHRERKDAELIWRGVIEHVQGNALFYFNHLDTLEAYFAKYLENMGIKL